MRSIEAKSIKIKDGEIYKDILVLGDINIEGLKEELKVYIDTEISKLPIAEEGAF